MIDLDDLDEREAEEDTEAADAGCVLLQAPTSGLGRRPRVACIHGGTSNAHIFRAQLRPLLARLGEEVDLVFLEGALLTDEVRFDERGKRNSKTMRAFFGENQVLREHAVTRYGDRGENGPYYYDRLEEGLGNLEAKLAALAEPVDALLGFSQGANFSTMLCARAARGDSGAPPPLRCAVLLENDRPGWPEQRPELFAAPLPVPVLVVAGQTESEAADMVSPLFTLASRASHADGHRPLPKDPKKAAEIVERVRAFLLQHCPP
mmetsp:Transcript_103947/g.324023  ORF Transcript_103947/g.324023 Transcript_103947/m.324023 type:complete len:263 (-) Transcript_103947:329-1117(-)